MTLPFPVILIIKKIPEFLDFFLKKYINIFLKTFFGVYFLLFVQISAESKPASEDSSAVRNGLFAIIDLILAQDDESDILPIPAPVDPGSGNSTPTIPIDPENTVPPGTANGTLSISDKGAATYSIPIIAAPGTAGVLPKLGLFYESSGGNGVLGVGWSIAGLSKITRCPRDIVHDGAKAGVKLTFDDRFCLDDQRLILISGKYYGAPDSEYRTEINNYTRVVAVGTNGNGPASFLVYLRDGSKIEYGNSADSRFLQTGHNTPHTWSINRFSDARTNYYSVTYIMVEGAGQHLPSRIDYTGNVAQGTSTYNSIRFFYDQNRPDVTINYFLGQKTTASSRLNAIRTYSGEDLVREYELDYEVGTWTGLSRIKSITECGAARICLPSTKFEWSNEAPNKSGPEIDYGQPRTEFGNLIKGDPTLGQWLDLNGDGKPEHCIEVSVTDTDTQLLCMIPNADGVLTANFVANSDSGFQVIDVNGDGRSEVCNDTNCFYSNPKGIYWLSTQVPLEGFSLPYVGFHVDLDGDGRYDYCRLLVEGNSNQVNLGCFIRIESGYGTLQKVATLPANSSYSWVDVSGDGIPSLCSTESNALNCRKWNGSGLADPIRSGPIDLGDSYKGRSWHDANGDGMADFCRIILDNAEQSSGSGRIACTLSTGVGFGDTIISGSIDVGNIYHAKTWVDVNGDGRLDFCRSPGSATIGNGVSCLLSKGSAFAGEVAFAQDDGQLVDANGDGLIDYCYTIFGSETRKCATSVTGPRADLIITITDGLGATTNLSYQPLSNPDVYTKGTTAVYPDNDVQDRTFVVSNVRSSDGINGYQETKYQYEGLRINLVGRGDLGFSAKTVTAPNGAVTKTKFHQDFPLTGLAFETQETYKNIVTSEKHLSYSVKAETVISIVETKNVLKTFDLNGAFINWVEVSTPVEQYDAWGNILESNTVYKNSDGTLDGYSQTVRSTFSNDVENWILGLRLNRAVISITPDSSSIRASSWSYLTTQPGLGLANEEIVEPDGAANLRLVRNFSYDNFGNLLTKKLKSQDIALFTELEQSFDAKGRGPIKQKNALGHVEKFEFDWRFGTLKQHVDANSLTTNFESDVFGRETSQTLQTGRRNTTTYSRCADCVPNAAYSISKKVISSTSGVQIEPSRVIYFDKLGREISRLIDGYSGNKIRTDVRYNTLGLLEEVSGNYSEGAQSSGATRYAYDTVGRRLKVTLPNGAEIKYSYNGREKLSSNPYSSWSERVDSQSQLVEKIEALGSSNSASIKYQYDNWGNLSKTTDSKGNSIVVKYDLLGRRLSQTDPDLGTTTYEVNAIGQVAFQKDSNSNITKFEYDLLGRMTKREEPDLISKWFYDADSSGVKCGPSFGKLCETSSGNGYSKKFGYDVNGRLTSSAVNVDRIYLTEWKYGDGGRLISQIFPTGYNKRLNLNFKYSSLGFMSGIENSDTNASYWNLKSENNDGNLTGEIFGNSLVGTREYDMASGHLSAIKLGSATSLGSIQNHSYHFDLIGRMDSRQDDSSGVKIGETFAYDNLNRISNVNLVAPGTGAKDVEIKYDVAGNIVSRTDLGMYTYPVAGEARPHAVSKITGIVNGVTNPSFSYDANGNMLEGAGSKFSWTSFNMPSVLEVKNPQLGVSSAEFLYGSDHHRIKQIWKGSNETITTIYADQGTFEKSIKGAGDVATFIHYIYARGRIVAIVSRDSESSETVRYLSTDHLGSVVVTTDESGSAVERQSYDVWGDNRGASGTLAGVPDLINRDQSRSGTAGFTGHEQLNRGGMGLINMNGRIYDPVIARFLSADPIIQSPNLSQSYNRYSYVWNSPLNATDPTGFAAEETLDQITATASRSGNSLGFGWSTACEGGGCQQFLDQALQSRVEQLGGRAGDTPNRTRRTPGDPLKGWVQERRDYGKNEDGELVWGNTARRVDIPDHSSGMVMSMIAVSASLIPFERAAVLGWDGYKVYRAGAAVKSPAQRLADKLRNLPSSKRPNTVAVIKHQDGTITIGMNQGGASHSIVEEALANAPKNCYSGQCAEINVLSRALNKGRSLEGAEVSVAWVRGPRSEVGLHGLPRPPCNTCASVLDQLKVEVK